MDSRYFWILNEVFFLNGRTVGDQPYIRIAYKFLLPKEKMTESISWRSHLFFFLILTFTLMNVYMNTGIK